MRVRSIALACAALAVAFPAAAERLPVERSEQAEANLRIVMLDLTPRFLAFYEAAASEEDADARFALWKEHYDFAAVPPGPRGEEMKRQLLDAGWPRYEAHLPQIRQGAAVFGDEPIRTLGAVAEVLQADVPIAMRLVAMSAPSKAMRSPPRWTALRSSTSRSKWPKRNDA